MGRRGKNGVWVSSPPPSYKNRFGNGKKNI